jgi:hypothetical protein
MKLILISLTFFLSIVSKEISINPSDEDGLRNLQQYKSRYSKTIYYSTAFIHNNITGSGNLLKDDAYRAVCLASNCTCCSGDINFMTCALPEDCEKWDNYVKSWRIAIITVIVFFSVFGFILGIVRGCNKSYTFCEAFGFAILIILIIVFAPIVVIVMFIKSCCNKCNKEVVKPTK